MNTMTETMIETTTAITTLTPIQFRVARGLAAGFSHLWADCPEGMYDVKDIAAWSESTEPAFGGIYAPSLNEEGEVVHQTGTGRTVWTVGRNGNVSVEIMRPGQEVPVLSALLNTSGTETFDPEWNAAWSATGAAGDFFERHWFALRKALVAAWQSVLAEMPRTLGIGEEPDAAWDASREAWWAAEQQADRLADELMEEIEGTPLPDPMWEGTVWNEASQAYELADLTNAYVKKQNGIGDIYYDVHDTTPVSVATPSERVAVHATLLLRAGSVTTALEAVNAATRSWGYRP